MTLKRLLLFTAQWAWVLAGVVLLWATLGKLWVQSIVGENFFPEIAATVHILIVAILAALAEYSLREVHTEISKNLSDGQKALNDALEKSHSETTKGLKALDEIVGQIREVVGEPKVGFKEIETHLFNMLKRFSNDPEVEFWMSAYWLWFGIDDYGFDEGEFPLLKHLDDRKTHKRDQIVIYDPCSAHLLEFVRALHAHKQVENKGPTPEDIVARYRAALKNRGAAFFSDLHVKTTSERMPIIAFGVTCETKPESSESIVVFAELEHLKGNVSLGGIVLKNRSAQTILRAQFKHLHSSSTDLAIQSLS